MRPVIILAAIALPPGAVTLLGISPSIGPAPAPAAPQARTPLTPAPTADAQFAIGRDCAHAQSHFDVDGRVNGRRVDFVVDTGASVVALTARDAARLGIHPSRDAFVADVKTAERNDPGRARPARRG